MTTTQRPGSASSRSPRVDAAATPSSVARMESAVSATPPRSGARGRSRWFWVSPALISAIFVLALLVLRHEVSAYSYHDVLREVWRLPASRLWLALGCTIAAYLVLPGYDWLALRYIGRRLPLSQVALASCTAYALSQTLGFPVITGGSVRYRFWSAWGLDTAEIAQAVSFAGLTFTLGMVMMVSLALAFEPSATLALVHMSPWVARPLSAVGVLVVVAYLTWSGTRSTPLRVRAWLLPVPPLRTAASQLALACLDWTFAALVLYALLPPDANVAFLPFLGAFLVAQVAGVVSHVPGGLGVFETLMLLLIGPSVGAPHLIAALVGFRVLYYLLPFSLGILTLAGAELSRQRAQMSRGVRLLLRLLPATMPTVLSFVIFAAGAVLLLSGATPAVHSRFGVLSELLPLGVIELSHFTGSVVGAGLLVLAWGARRRVRVAWAATVVLLAMGILASMLKGLDWEEALILSVVLAVVLPSRDAFDRPAALLREPLSPDWIAAVLAVTGGVTILLLFAYQRVEYRDSLWWHVAPQANAARSLRALVGAAGVFAIFGAARLLSPARVEHAVPDAEDLQDAARIAAGSEETESWLALLADKALLFNEARTAFIMYAVEGRSWVALGDPIGPESEHADLAWRFKEEALRHGGWPVFYEVGPDHLPLYVDLGLTLQKLGESATVRPASFSLDGASRRGFRRTIRDVEHRGAVFTVHDAAETPALLPTLREVSDAWLETKAAREKGFSLGCFDEAYLSHFPMATVSVNGRIVAFTNLWMNAARTVLSLDLMRYVPDAPPGVMEYLFLQLILWAQREGFQRFQLGMAPMSGMETRRSAPMWHRMGALLYRHGEHFYNFRGLRAYKEKFDPDWTPRYLASPGGLVLPRILANVTTLISGGVTGVVSR